MTGITIRSFSHEYPSLDQSQLDVYNWYAEVARPLRPALQCSTNPETHQENTIHEESHPADDPRPDRVRAGGAGRVGRADDQPRRAQISSRRSGRRWNARARSFSPPDGQPFVVAGSGTLAMDMAAANLIEPGDRALVVNTGFFGDRMGAILERYGAQVTHVTARRWAARRIPTRSKRRWPEVDFKLVTITQVDTSTGVLADVKALAAAGARVRRAGGGRRRLLGGRRGTAHGRVGRGRGVHRVAKGDQRAAGSGAGGGASGCAGSVQGAQDAGRQLLRRLDQLAADHGGVRSAQAGLLRHPGGQSGLGAERQPGPDPRGGDGRPRRPSRQAGPRLPGGHRRAGAGPGAAGARRSRRTP